MFPILDRREGRARRQEFAAAADRLFAEHPDVYRHVGAEVTPFALAVFVFRQGGLRSLWP